MSRDCPGRPAALLAVACAMFFAGSGAVAAPPESAPAAPPVSAASAPPMASTPSAARPDPGDATAAVPALAYRSSLERYRRHTDVTPRPWREANDEVLRIGGWRSYLRESAAPAASGAGQ